jgi:hypothetical protein
MPQFNGKQEGFALQSDQIFNLRCPRNGKTNESCNHFWLCIQLSSLATETPEQGLGKAMKAVSSARIPANKVMVRPE